MDDFLLFVAIGFAAQLIDGAIGMAYGLTAMTILLNFGILPVIASASIHAAEVFTTGASGLSHWFFGNIDRRIIWRLAIAGMLGGVAGAYLLIISPAEIIRIGISLYLLAMGSVILWKVFWKRPRQQSPARYAPILGLSGGFLDAIGGGGWGPIVTSTLIGRGMTPRLAIGSSNAAEFFVTTAVSATFIATIGLELWPVIVGLIIGGVLAAPFAAYATRRMPDRSLMILVSIVIMLLSCRQLILAFFEV